MDNKFYWIKLKTDFFNQDSIDFLMSQENGCEYIVLYQMLCLNTANSNGELTTKIGEVIVPYDVKKIARDSKYFDVDTVIVALELFKKLGLIYEQNNNILKISNIGQMIGSESASRDAIKKREYRAKLLEDKTEDKQGDIVGDKKGTNCPTEYRDKSIEIRNNIYGQKSKRFLPPTLEEVKQYCLERKNEVDAQKFIDFYSSKGWYVGKNKMKDWKASVRTWEKNERVYSNTKSQKNEMVYSHTKKRISDINEREYEKGQIDEDLNDPTLDF